MRNAGVLASITALIVLCALVPACGPQMAPTGMAMGSPPEAGPKAVEGGMQFVFFAPKAKRVAIVGDFNNWSTGADPMFNRETSGLWSIVLPLKSGRYEYKFLVDGEKWTTDPGNPKRTKDGFGGFNSVVEVGP